MLCEGGIGVRRNRKKANPLVWLAVLGAFLLLYLAGNKSEEPLISSVVRIAGGKMQNKVWPIVAFSSGQMNATGRMMPLYGYAKEQEPIVFEDEERLIALEEIDEQVGLYELLREENLQVGQSQETQVQSINSEQDVVQTQVTEQPIVQDNGFIPHTLMQEVDLNLLSDYETLVKNYYTIDASTAAGNDQLSIDKLLDKKMTVSKEGEEPKILIYHTHSQEAFADSVPGDKSTTIVGVGERLTQILTDTYGYKVLHHTGKYDVKVRDDAYAQSLPAIEKLLAENPSIEVVIDLHRDQMPEGTKLLMDLDGRPTARFMFFNGMSRTRKTGNISYLYNENLQDNLRFSFQMQLTAAKYYPGLTRKIYLKSYRYNMHLKPKTLLVELGAQNNTVEEAMNACDPLAHILDLVLSGQGC